jgi:uncharacterized protein (TIGR02265 family)
VFGVLGGDVGNVLMQGPKGYSIALNFGSVTSERKSDRVVIARFRGLPALLETYQVGIIEGTVKRCGATPEIRIDIQSLADADIEIRWS